MRMEMTRATRSTWTRHWHIATATLAVAALAMAAPAMAAPTDAQKCESSFELASAKFAQCRLGAESKYTKTLDPVKLSTALGKCATKLSDALNKAVTKYGGGNCTAETPAAFDTYLTQCSNDVEAASAIGGALPDYVGDLAACNGDLSTCNGNLTTCNADLAACEAAPAGTLVETGQTSCWDPSSNAPISCTFTTAQDGAQQRGLAIAYVDNGDGTITDTNTGLMWEKLSDDGSVHDKDNTYTWAQALDTRLGTLNGGGGFAGHTDWRLPNSRELYSLVNLGNVNPSVSPAFNTACAPACTVLTCSCTRSNFYWSSSTYATAPSFAWVVDFNGGYVNAYNKGLTLSVRAVRGGS